MANATAPLSARAQERVAVVKVDQLYRTVRTTIRVGGGCFLAWCLYLSIDSVAGKTTAFQAAVTVGFSFLWDFRFVLAFSVAGVAGLWAAAERWLRHRKVEHLQGRIKDLESQIDPGRSTSGLTTKGRTNPRDRRL
jgi:hypothetical protein